MVITVSQQPIDFVLQGQVSRFKVGKHQRIRHFDLVSDQGRHRFKVPHSLHRHSNLQLKEGDEVRVSGSVLIDAHKRRMKLKLQGLQLLADGGGERESLKVVTEIGALQGLDPRASALAGTQGKLITQRVLVCKSSSCWKQGGREIYQRLQESGLAIGADASIRVETTGCMGRCKSGPNVKLMPDKVVHRGAHTTDVPDIIQRLASAS